MGRSLPKRQRVAAYAVILRDDQILLSRLAPRISADELWTLPGGGLDHGEDPARRRGARDPRGDRAARRWSARPRGSTPLHLPGVWRERQAGRRARPADRVRRAGCRSTRRSPAWSRSSGSTVEAAWHPLADVLAARSRSADRARGAGRPQPVPDAADGGVRPDPPRRHGAAHPDLRPRRTPRLVDAARRRHRPRRVAPAARGPRGARGVRRRLRGRRAARRARRPLRRYRADRAARGLPRRAPGLRRRPSPTTPSRGSPRSTAPPTRSPGCPPWTWRRGRAARCLDVVRHALDRC